MKRLLSLFISLTLALGTSTPAFAVALAAVKVKIAPVGVHGAGAAGAQIGRFDFGRLEAAHITLNGLTVLPDAIAPRLPSANEYAGPTRVSLPAGERAGHASEWVERGQAPAEETRYKTIRLSADATRRVRGGLKILHPLPFETGTLLQETVQEAVAHRPGSELAVLKITEDRLGRFTSEGASHFPVRQIDEALRRFMDGGGAVNDNAEGDLPVRPRTARRHELPDAKPAGLKPAPVAASPEGLHVPEQDIPDPRTKKDNGSRGIYAAYNLWRWILGPIFTLLYHPQVRGFKNLPKEGPGILLPNHVTWIDVFLISFLAQRPVRFLMYKSYYENPKLNWFVKRFEPIPIEPGNRKQVDGALAEARAAIEQGDLIAIFPEGSFTANSNLRRFKRGMETIIRDLKVPVIPVHLDGFWGTYFSRKPGRSLWKSFKRLGRPLYVRFGKPLENATVDTARDAVEQLSSMNMRERVRKTRKPLGLAFLDSAYRNWRRRAVSDSTGKSLSYGELLTGSTLLGRVLAKQLGKAKNVGVMIPPTVGGALANVALAQLGRTSVNLNYTSGSDAMLQSVETAGLDTVITSRKFVEQLEKKTGRRYDIPVNWIFLEDLAPQIPKWKKTALYIFLRLSPKALTARLFFKTHTRMNQDATLIFTSGSTARPKGVRLTHLNIQSNIKMMENVFNFSQRDTLLGVLPFFHSFGFTATLWMPLLNGIHAVFHTSPLEPKPIEALAKKYGPTILLGTPSFLRSYRQHISAEAFGKLKLVIAGAEKLYVRDADRFEEKFGVRPLEGYGLTETSPVSAVNVPDVYGPNGKLAQRGNKPGSVGHPPPGVAIRIVDPVSGDFLPARKEGHILIKGPHVMPGYYGDAVKSAEVLRGGWYLTGDIGYRDRDGFLYITGRMERFSKVMGEKVSHDAVEESLHAALGAEERVFAVAGAPDGKTGEKLVVLYTEFDGSIEEVLRAVGDKLANVQKPRKANFYKVDEIPQLGSGKMDIKAVAQLALELAAAGK